MKKRKVKYTDKHIGKIRTVDDFIPHPKNLVLKDETKKEPIEYKIDLEDAKNSY